MRNRRAKGVYFLGSPLTGHTGGGSGAYGSKGKIKSMVGTLTMPLEYDEPIRRNTEIAALKDRIAEDKEWVTLIT